MGVKISPSTQLNAQQRHQIPRSLHISLKPAMDKISKTKKKERVRHVRLFVQSRCSRICVYFVMFRISGADTNKDNTPSPKREQAPPTSTTDKQMQVAARGRHPRASAERKQPARPQEPALSTRSDANIARKIEQKQKHGGEAHLKKNTPGRIHVNTGGRICSCWKLFRFPPRENPSLFCFSAEFGRGGGGQRELRH